jgi:hypothetical protein
LFALGFLSLFLSGSVYSIGAFFFELFFVIESCRLLVLLRKSP